ncbi:unnamed protein product [Calicophoron daubneyi]|uniref:TLC domain-containing protein n=1 Tax=Calicophoron daubneyi TaxID=300641 RepID=A0AAV2U147_CALDB
MFDFIHLALWFVCISTRLSTVVYTAAVDKEVAERPLILDEETGQYFPISDYSLREDSQYLRPEPNPEDFPPEYLESLSKHCDDPIPSVTEFLQRAWISFKEFGLNWSRYPVRFKEFVRVLYAIRLSQVFHAFLVGLLLSVLRFAVQKIILHRITTLMGIPLGSAQRLIESSWKAFWFLTLWLCTFHALILKGRTDFQYPLRILKGKKFEVGYFDVPTPPDYYRIYTLQLGFYMHSLWSVVCIDAWRKDSAVLVIHHFMTILLLEFSLVLRLHRLGALVVFLHDLNDVFLEVAKCNVYLQVRNGRTYPIHIKLSNFFFTIFTISWMLMRLYWYPLKVLYATSWGAYINLVGRDCRSFLFFNTMLWALFLMHIYWFRFISIMAVRLLFHPLSGDIREEELDAKQTKDLGVQDKGVKAKITDTGAKSTRLVKKPNGITYKRSTGHSHTVTSVHLAVSK